MSTVLVVVTPVTGHVRPLLPVVRALSEAGHDVLVSTGRKFARWVEDAGARHLPVVHGRDLDDATIDAWSLAHGAPGPGLRRAQWDVRHHFIDLIEGDLADVREAVARYRPDVLVADANYWAAGFAAREHGLPLVLVTVTVLLFSDPDLPPMGLGLRPARGPAGRVAHRALQTVVEHVVFRAADREARRTVAELGMPVPRSFFFDWPVELSDRIAHTTVPGLEYPRRDLPATVEYVGPCLPRGVDAVEPPAWWDDVAQARADGRPVVLVTQGTVSTDPDRLLRPAVAGLADRDVLVLATTATGDPALVGAPGRPDNLRVAPFLPFDRVLPSVDVMVTNGGFGGVQQALSHGVPLVVAGRTEDKVDVGARVAWSGVGTVLRTDPRTDAVTPGQVAAGVDRVLGDPAYRSRARALADEYARYDGAARTAAIVEEAAVRGRTVRPR